MQKVQINGRNIHLSQKIEEHVEKKLSKLDRYLPKISEIRVDLATEGKGKGGERAIAQLTVRNERGVILRSEDRTQSDVFVAVDQAIDKMYRQISRFKGKKSRRAGGTRFGDLQADLNLAEALPINVEEAEEELLGIVRRKEVELVPMSEEEAIDQMELLDHDFFMFYNADAGKINVLYRRKQGGFGLLTPSIS